MKKYTLYVGLIMITLAMQSCPISQNNDKVGCAFLISPQDIVDVRSYDLLEDVEYHTYYACDYPQQMSWTPEQSEKTPHSVELHELHIRKRTNKSESIVIEGYGLYINDEYWTYLNFSDIPDRTREIIDPYTGEVQTLDIHFERSPYDLEDVIKELDKNYPELVHRINDTEEHSFKHYEVSHYRNAIPRITIDTTMVDTMETDMEN